MRVKPRKSIEVPAPIKAFVDQVVNTPLESLADALEGFKLNQEKGDFFHWTALFNHIDAFFEKFVSSRSDVQLLPEKGEPAGPFPTRNVLAALHVTATILEACHNKHLYQSYEHLASLLAAPEPQVVRATLGVLVAFVRRTNNTPPRFTGNQELNARLLSMAQGWGGKEQGLELVACASANEARITQYLHVGSKLHFEFYESLRRQQQASEGSKDAGASASSGGLRVIDIPNLHTYPESEQEVYEQLVKRYNVPVNLRFSLLTSIRVAKRFATLEGRRSLVADRLMAFFVLLQANPHPDDMAAFFLTEGEFVSEVVGLLEADDAVPVDIRILALRALGVQLHDRQRHSSVIAALTTGGQSGLLSSLMHRCVASLIQDGDAGLGPTYAEALLSLVGALVASTSGCSALSEAGLIPAFLPLLRDTNPEHVSLVSATVRIMEAYMDFSPSASTLFRDLGGLREMINRLQLEVGVQGMATQQSPMDTDAKGQAPSSPPAAGTEELKPVAYSRRVLLKALLRAIALASYTPGSGARPQEEDSVELYKCLRIMMERSKEFGGSLFALAASVITDLIHHDPLCYRSVDAAGLPQAFIDSIKAGVLPFGEALCCVPTTLVALCLNTAGQERVRESRALDSLIPIFTTSKYLRAIAGDNAGVLGTGLDELMRHVPALREACVGVVLNILRTLARQGGASDELLQELGVIAIKASALDAAEPMDTEAAGTSADAGPSRDVEMSAAEASTSGAARPAEANAHLPECIQYSARMVEALLSNAETSRLFVQRGGAEHLMAMYRLPNLPPTFGSSSPSHALMAALRTLAPNHAKHIAKLLHKEMAAQLQKATSAAESIGDKVVPMLPAEQRDDYVRQVSTLEGFVGLAASISRSSQDLLAEVSRGGEPIIVRLARLERTVVWHLALADDWKHKHDRAKEADSAKERERAARETEAAVGGSEELPDAVGGAGADGAVAASGVAPVEALLEAAETLAGAAEADQLAAPSSSSDAQHVLSIKGRKKSGEELSYEVLQHFAATTKGLYQQLAKAIHVPVRRREDVVQPPPSAAMQATAVGLSVLLKDNLASFYRHMPVDVHQIEGGAGPGTTAAVLSFVKYSLHFMEELSVVLLDGRRKTCHSLVFNYFMAGRNLQGMLGHFTLAAKMLLLAISQEKAAAQHDAGPAATPMEDVSASSSRAGAAGNVLEGLPTTKQQGGASPKKLIARERPSKLLEALVEAYLKVMDHMASASRLLSSPHAATLLLAPLPGRKPSGDTQPVENLVRRVQALVLRAVLPLWSDPTLATFAPQLARLVIGILTNCMDGTALDAASAAVRASTRPAVHRPDPAVVQQIVEMGFTQPRAEEALRRVQHNSVELAMEWLISHPDEPAAPASAAASAAPQSAEEAELTNSLLGSLHADSAAEEDGRPAEAPDSVHLVDGAVSVLANVPTAAFSLVDLLTSMCRHKNGKEREAVVKRLIGHLRGDYAAPGEEASRSDNQLLAPAHLLAVLTVEQGVIREVVYKNGLVEVALDLIEGWLRTRLGHDPAAVDVGVKESVPRWIDALLLILDSAIRTQPTPSPAAPEDGAQQAPGAEGGSVQAAGTSAETDQQTPLANQQLPGAGRPATASSAERPVEDSISSLHKAISKLYRPGGLLTDQEQQRAALVCMRLLQHLHCWAADWTPQEANTCPISTPRPVSNAQAVLQLLARLTKRHSIALQVLAGKGPKLMMELPSAALQPELEPHMSAIMRHILEDPSTLQSAMEAEIRNTFASGNRSRPLAAGAGQQSSMTVRQFLSTTAAVIGREPSVFLEAVMATCCVSEVSGRPMIRLKPPKAEAKAEKRSADASAEPAAAAPGNQSTPAAPIRGGSPTRVPEGPRGSSPTHRPEATPRDTGRKESGRRASFDARTPKPAKEDGKDLPKSVAKGGKKTVPASFVEVIDCLVDILLRYQGVTLDPLAKPQAAPAEGSAAMDVDASGSDARVRRPEIRTLTVEGATGITQFRMEMPPAPVRNPLTGLMVGPPSLMEAKEEALKQPLNTKEREVLDQCIALKMLTDFTLMYNSCVGVLLRRDAEVATRGGSPTARGSRPDGEKPVGALFRHIMHSHLAHDPMPTYAMQGLADQCSFFLLAICIRSAEGRRRIINCIVKALRNQDLPPNAAKPTDAAMDAIPFKVASGAPPPYKVKAFVELVGSLLSASGPGNTGRSGVAAPGLSTEMVRAMRDAGITKALTTALKLIDMDHPKAAQSINAMLKPLEILTRPMPARAKPPAALGAERAATQGAGAVTASADGTQQPAAGEPSRGQAQQARDGQVGGQDARLGEQEEEESAAGPEAVAAAERAIEAYDRAHAGGPGRGVGHRMEDMVEAIMERAYAEEIMEGYDSDSQGGSSEDDRDMDDEDMGEGPMSDEDEGHPMGEDSGEDEDGMSHDYSSEHSSDQDDEGDEDDEEDEDDDDDDHPEEADLVLEGEEEGVMDQEEDDEQVLLGAQHFLTEDLAYEDEEDAAIIREAGEDGEDDAEDFQDAGWDEEDEGEEVDEEDEEDADEDADVVWDQDAPEGQRARHVGVGGIHPTQAMIEELFGSALARNGLGNRQRFRIVNPQPAQQQTSRPSQPLQHSLLQRPPPSGTAASSGQPGTADMHPITNISNAIIDQLGLRGRINLGQGGMFPADQVGGGHGGGYVVFPENGNPGAPAAPGRSMAGPGGAGNYNSILNLSIDMLLGNTYPLGRADTRMINWSDDGTPPSGATAAAPGLVAGSLERQLVDALRQNGPSDGGLAGPASTATDAERGIQAAAAADPRMAELNRQEQQAREGLRRAQRLLAAVHGRERRSSLAGAEVTGGTVEQVPSAPGGASAQQQAGHPQPVLPEAAHQEGEPRRDQQEPAVLAERGTTGQDAPATSLPVSGGVSAETMASIMQNVASVANQSTPSTEAAQQAAAAPAAEAPPPVPARAASDEEMVDADAGTVPRAEDIDMTGAQTIDQAFLDALPPELRGEMISAQSGDKTGEPGSSQPPATGEAQAEVQPAAGTAEAPAEAPPAASEPTSSGPPAAEAEDDVMDGIDPDFIAALPPDLQAEVLEQQRRERRNRQALARRAEAEQAAAAGAQPAGPLEMDMASVLASFPPEVREEVLLTSDESMLATLPPALLAEAQALRERVIRNYRDRDPLGAGIAVGSGRNVLHIPRDPRAAARSRFGLLQGEDPAQRAAGGTAGVEAAREPEGPSQIEEDDLETLVSLMRLSQPIAKQLLQRLFLNLCAHPLTRAASLRILLSLLRAPMVGDELLESAASPMAVGAGTSGTAVEAGEVTPPAGRLSRTLSSLQESLPQARDMLGLSPVVSRRVLDLLTYLARNQAKVATELPSLHVPQPRVPQDEKGKGIAQASADEQALQVLFGLLGRTLCRRSNSHLTHALHLLEVLLSTAKSVVAQHKAAAENARPALPSVPEDQEAQPGSQPDTQAAPATSDASMGQAGGSRTAAEGEAGPFSASARTASAPTPAPKRDTGQASGSGAGGEEPSAVKAVGQLPEHLLRQLPELLGQVGLSEVAYTRAGAVIQLVVDTEPRHRSMLLAELDAQLQRVGQTAAVELNKMMDSSLSNATVASGAGQAGTLVLRILQALAALCKPTASKASQDAVEVAEVARRADALEQVDARLSSLWATLSRCLVKIAAGLESSAQASQDATSRILPPGAPQVLPLVEAFFVLCDARTLHLPQPQAAMLRAASVELSRAASSELQRAPSSRAHGGLQPQQAAAVEAHLPFLWFAEKHRRLLNALLRQNPALLEGSLAPLLRTARLVDFDNKRAYFRSRVRNQHSERHYGSLRIGVRRDHVFEDSFHQLRVRTPEEMRAKLSVQFQGEEGIDAGGVSREWYQVMAREMFNPNFSLFVPVPEGGSTFQPNPNSVVQNDEARGTNHLDFFKFVGRVVGKALYDGQFVDAYFTRSLYKHMLDQPLTYQDIEAVDPEYFKNLAWMLENDITDVLDLTFTEEVDFFGRKELVELRPGGAGIRVTEDNKREYVDLVAQHRMTTVIRSQLNAFLGGFWDLIPKELISLFNDHELELMISGLPEIDVDDLRANTEYTGYTAASATIQWFWEVVRGLDKEDLALLVQFVTGTSKVPLEGFKALQGISGPQKFSIHKAYGPKDRLPSAHTCFNQLDLLEYDNKAQLHQRIMTAIHEGSEGFGFA